MYGYNDFSRGQRQFCGCSEKEFKFIYARISLVFSHLGPVRTDAPKTDAGPVFQNRGNRKGRPARDGPTHFVEPHDKIKNYVHEILSDWNRTKFSYVNEENEVLIPDS